MFQWKFIFLTILYCSCVVSAHKNEPLPSLLTNNELSEEGYRLSNNTFPIHYDIQLLTNVHKEDFGFSGEVKIRFKVVDSSSFVTLNKRRLTINSYALYSLSGQNEIKINEQYDSETELLTYKLVNGLLKQNELYELKIKFNGTLETNGRGFYRTYYVDARGEKRWIATTHFEPTGARAAFPCYDEPGIRATYDISITHGSNFSAVANMPVLSRTILKKDPGMTVTKFETMPSVQTYLLAFVVSDYASISKTEYVRVPQILLAKSYALEAGQGDFALLSGDKVLTQLQNYFSTNYTLPHMQQIAIPGFGGAMENWGLVIYGEGSLLYDTKTGSLFSKHGTGHIISHEFAHQFFGNLVAPLWWSYVWLNEGFATYYAAKLMSLVYPEFQDIEYFVVNDMQIALHVDANSDTRPMTYYVENPSSIGFLFDTVAYQKSGSVLRMWEHALTERTWKKGITKYLTAKGNKAATNFDLSEALQEAADEDGTLPTNIKMKDVVLSWTEQPGFPLVDVAKFSDNKITLIQSRFVYNRKAKLSKQTDPIFMIPISIATDKYNASQFDSTAPYLWLTKRYLEIETSKNMEWDIDSWIILNKQQSGYYRVNYDYTLWNLLSKKLRSNTFTEIHVLNRAQLLDDALYLGQVNLVSYKTVFRLLDYLTNEQEYPPWKVANPGLEFLDRQLQGTEVYKLFLEFTAKISKALYNRLGPYDKGCDEPIFDKHARPIAIKWACSNGGPECGTKIKRKMYQLLENPETKTQIVAGEYCHAFKYCTVQEYEMVWKRMTHTDGPLRLELMETLACCEAKNVQKKYLESTIDENSHIYSEAEKIKILRFVIERGGVNGVHSSIDFIGEHYRQIAKFFTKPEPVQVALHYLIEFITTPELFVKFENLLNNLVANNILNVNQKEAMLEVPRQNSEWRNTNMAEVEAVLLTL